MNLIMLLCKVNTHAINVLHIWMSQVTGRKSTPTVCEVPQDLFLLVSSGETNYWLIIDFSQSVSIWCLLLSEISVQSLYVIEKWFSSYIFGFLIKYFDDTLPRQKEARGRFFCQTPKVKICQWENMCWTSRCAWFYPRASTTADGESTGDCVMCCRGDSVMLSFCFSCSFSSRSLSLQPPPLSFTQALNLLASPWAKRGVRVGSICLCDGHWCQAPQGLEGEESRLVWIGRVTDVFELSCGTSNRG